MKEPIIEASEPNDILVFETKEKAERYIEAIDLQNGEVTLYDSEGRLLSAKPHPNGSIMIEPNDSEPTHKDELKKALISFLKLVEEDKKEVLSANLEKLVERALNYKVE